MRFARIVGFFIGALVSAESFAGEFTLVAVGAFGEPLTECRVERFRPTGTVVKGVNDYKGHFRGLVTNDVPDGKYSADIGCQEARIGTYVTVSSLHRFEVVSENRRIARSDPPPHLVIRINSPRPQGETWWLTAQALYAERVDTIKFQSDTGEAAIIDPDPGSYVISILSSTGYSCVREIDLVERTRLWTFDPAACAFHVDVFAHVVTDEDKRELKTTNWYKQLRKSEEELWHAVEKLKEGVSDSNSVK